MYSPNLTMTIDYNCFKQTKEEKSDAVMAKHRHKLFMQKNGVNHKKFLNIPKFRLETPIVITT